MCQSSLKLALSIEFLFLSLLQKVSLKGMAQKDGKALG